MAKPSKALSSLIIVVVFLALIAVATVLYSGGPDQKVRLEQNFLARNTKLAMDYAWVALQGATDIGLGKEHKNNEIVSSAAEIDQTPETGLFKKISVSIREEWDKEGGRKLGPASEIDLSRIWQWQKTAFGAEIIFKGKNGEEHKIGLPFKFWVR